MRLSFKEKQIALREAHLAREMQLYASVPYGTFNKIKDWDDKGPTVIWEGTIVSPSCVTGTRSKSTTAPLILTSARTSTLSSRGLKISVIRSRPVAEQTFLAACASSHITLTDGLLA